MKILILNGHDNYGNGGAENVKYGSEQELTRNFSTLLSDALRRDDVEVTVFNPKITDVSMYSYLNSHGGRYNFDAYDRVIELHFNSGVIDMIGNKRQTGTEILLHKNPFIGDGIIAAKILDKLASIGLRSRGIKHRSDLYVMNTCYSQGVSYMLWEICFIGDVDDMEFYTTHMKEIAKVFADEYIANCDLDGEWYYINTYDKSALNIRSSKNASSSKNIIGAIPNGIPVKVVKDKDDDGWATTSYRGISGYVVSKYLTKVKRGKVVTPSGGRLRIRRTPSTNGHINGHLENGSNVFLYGLERNLSGETWRAVGLNIGEIAGYSRSDYLKELE